MKKRKRGIALDSLALWIIAIIVLVIFIFAIVILKSKGINAIEYIKNLFRFRIR